MELPDIAGTWSIPNPFRYFVTILVAALAIRAFHSALRAVKDAHENNQWAEYWSIFGTQFGGFQPPQAEMDAAKRASSDYWYTFILGVIELAMYGPLMAAHAWTAIAAWIGLKTLAQWRVWTDDRSVFNLFLIGTMTCVFAAFFFVRPLVQFSQ